MAIKTTINQATGTSFGAKVNTFPKAQRAVIADVIDTLNNVIDGSISTTDLTLAGTLAVTGVSTLTGGIVAGKGNITQTGAITTGVATGATPAGVITTVSTTLAGNTNATFIVTNGLVTETSVIMLTVDDSLTASVATVNVQGVSAGVFSINISNITAVAFNNKIKINYLIV